jgi:hypothetical protein
MKIGAPVIHLASDLESYFFKELSLVSAKHGISISSHTHQYLAGILSRFSKSRNYFQIDPETEKNQIPTLAMLWLEGQTKPLFEQLEQFRGLGDLALFTSGFFKERILKSSLDVDYYIAIGERAYEKAGQIRETLASEQALNVFFELSEVFPNIVEIFSEISDQKLLSSNEGLIALYEKWLSTKSDRVKRMLAESGVLSGTKGESS